MNHEDYCSYDLARAMYYKDFDWDCERAYYDNARNHNHDLLPISVAYKVARDCDGTDIYPACTLSQAQKWLREEIGIAINVTAHDGGFYQWEEIYLPNAPEYECFIEPDIVQYSTYEQALSAGLLKTIESI